MILHSDDSNASYQIKRYEPGKVWINQQVIEQNLILWPHHILVPWGPKNLSEAVFSDFQALIDSPVSILLIGTGQEYAIPSQKLLNPLFEKGIGVEFMNTRAACHTFTILAAEQRKVAACLFLS